MRELLQTIPDVEVLLALEPEELASKLLFLMHARPDMAKFHPGNLELELWDFSSGRGAHPYAHRRDEVELALTEAWAWLEAQGLVVGSDSNGAIRGWRRLSRRARRFENDAEFAGYTVARRLPKDALHPKIAHPVWMALMRSEFDVAVFQAMKAVEVAVRDASKLPAKEIGTNLMRRAFDPKSGPLTDHQAEMAEREARSALFAGAIGSYKNPHSHRDIQLNDPAEAIEVILLANHLLRRVDSRS